MTTSRQGVLWSMVAAHAASRDRSVSVADVCAVAATVAQSDGAWLIAGSGRAPDFILSVTDPLSEQLAELQLTLGEGPCQDVYGSAAPVLGPGLDDAESGRRWPAFAPEARRLGVAVIFAFPLAIGAIRTGVLGLYRSSAGRLSRDVLGDCLILADTATVLLLEEGSGTSPGSGGAAGSPGGQPADLALHRVQIDQATGMLTVQLGVSAADAFVRLRAYAYAHDRRLADVARDIVARRLRLDPAPDGES